MTEQEIRARVFQLVQSLTPEQRVRLVEIVLPLSYAEADRRGDWVIFTGVPYVAPR